jgi:hypothetical protein
VWDHDAIGQDDVMGEVTVSLDRSTQRNVRTHLVMPSSLVFFQSS